MEQQNKKIIEEYLLLNQALKSVSHNLEIIDGYSWYNNNMKDCYTSLINKYATVLETQNLQTNQEFVSTVSNMQLTPEQKRALKIIQKEPVFKKLMGEIAISKKDTLEKILEQEITYQGMMYADENGPKQSIKSVEILENERQAIYDKLSSKLSIGTITPEQYTDYLDQVDYIYNYYESMSMGEQIPFRKISDLEIVKIQSEAYEEGVDFDVVLNEKNAELLEKFKEFHAEIREKKSVNPKYEEFKTEIEKKNKDIETLLERKKQIESLLDDVYKEESEISKNLPFEERSFQKLVIQIREKDLEIKIMNIEASIKNIKNWIYQKELGILRMENTITPEQYSFQIDDAKTNHLIDDNYKNIMCLYEENDLYSMQIKLLGMKTVRGEITEEERNIGYQELNKKISENDKYISNLQEDLSTERRKQIEKQIAFRYNQGIITKETKEAQIEALSNFKELTSNSEIDISNIFVDEDGITHSPKR